jgi:hypothetical protein
MFENINPTVLIILVLILILVVVILYKYYFVNKEYFTNNPTRGYYLLSWATGAAANAPDGDWDYGIWFGGETPINAINNNINLSSKITKGKKLLDLGGGLDTGIWSGQSDFDYINSRLADIKNAGWDGLCFDVEVCANNINFIDMFSTCFAKCKQAGLIVYVTTSHTNPYSCQTGSGQGIDLINSWINDSNVDFISPQLYSSGTTLEVQDLSIFNTIQNKILVSIPYSTDWATLNTDNIGITPAGYVVWNVLPPQPNPPNPPPPGPSTSYNYCGTNWDTVNCSYQCPSAMDSECPSGLKCWAGMTQCGPNSGGDTRSSNHHA